MDTVVLYTLMRKYRWTAAQADAVPAHLVRLLLDL